LREYELLKRDSGTGSDLLSYIQEYLKVWNTQIKPEIRFSRLFLIYFDRTRKPCGPNKAAATDKDRVTGS
jgi:hypothetical protein